MNPREIADYIIQEHGELKEVRLLGNGDITIKFANGNEIKFHSIDLLFKWGYMGTGPTRLCNFLRRAGFKKVNEKLISQIKAPYTFKRS